MDHLAREREAANGEGNESEGREERRGTREGLSLVEKMGRYVSGGRDKYR